MAAIPRNPDATTAYKTTYCHDESKSLSEVVVDAIAAVEGVEPTNLDMQLYESLDADALDTLYATAIDRGEHLELEFTLREYTVVVDSSGQIHVRTPR